MTTSVDFCASTLGLKRCHLVRGRLDRQLPEAGNGRRAVGYHRYIHTHGQELPQCRDPRIYACEHDRRAERDKHQEHREGAIVARPHFDWKEFPCLLLKR